MGLPPYETFGSTGRRQAEEIIADIRGWGRNSIMAARLVESLSIRWRSIALLREGAPAGRPLHKGQDILSSSILHSFRYPSDNTFR